MPSSPRAGCGSGRCRSGTRICPGRRRRPEMAGSLALDVDDGVAFVTFNRPERLNALDLTMAGALSDAVATLGGRGDVRVVVLRGAGSAFMAGGDVSLFHGEQETVAA